MKRIPLLCGAVLAAMLAPASATSINLATGQNGSGTIQTAGDSLDANWTETNATAALSAPNMYVVAPNNADWFGGWFANGPNSSWVAPNPDNAGGNGNFVASFSFFLSASEAASASITGGQWSIDDQGVLALNGNALDSEGNGQWGTFHSFTTTASDFVVGMNTLTMTSQNSDIFLEAVRLEGTLNFTPDTSPVPEPATLLLMGAGLAGLGLRRRRKAG